MTDLTPTLLPELKNHRLPGLDLPEELIAPKYDGQSILNTPNSVCRLLGIPAKNDIPTLRPEILGPFLPEADRVLVVLVDALALHRFQAWRQERPEMVWNQFAESGVLAPLTSIAPSTTSAAITTYWTAEPPRTHGIVGYEMWLKEFGMVVNSIQHTPMSFRGGGTGSLEYAGFSPQDFLPVDRLAPHLIRHGIEPHAFQHYSIINSGLSEMFMDQAHRHGVNGVADLWYQVWQLWEEKAGEKLYTWVYWSDVDSLSHLYGPEDGRIPEEFASFSLNFERIFLDRLSPKAKENSLVILTADHGQIATNKEDDHYDLRNHPDFTRRLHILPTSENRLSILHIKPGQTEAVREYIERTWPNQFTLLESAYAIEKGLLGPGQSHSGLVDRTGDLIALARGQAFWWWGDKPNPIIGRHGGLSEEEMVVPFLAGRL